MRGQPSTFRKHLLQWFAQHQRALPWRTHPSLYATTVSEFMLQQTQVDTVLPYFERWMKSFPDFASLAKATEERVLKHWEGLGYYSRARNLHKLAKSIIENGIPDSVQNWQKRPGIGPYTAAAISSIAQNVPEPVIDGNVIRVLARIANDPQPVKSSAEAIRRFRPLAGELIDPQQPGPFNEAMMELGATICRKKRPACLLCPVKEHCLATREGDPETLPVIVRKQTRRYSVSKLWAVLDGKLLLYVHPDHANRLAGLAELPKLRSEPAGKPMLSRSRGISSELIREHIFTRPEFASPQQAIEACDHPPEHLKWVDLEDLPKISLSAPHRRWIEELLSQAFK